MGPRWRYLLGEVGVGLRRNPLMIIATVVTVTVCLALLGAGLLLQRQVNLTRSLFFSQVEVSIFLHDDIAESQRVTLERELTEHPVVEEVIYESKQQAYEHFQEIFADDPVMQQSVTPDILPASFRVRLEDPEQYAVIESQFAGYPGVEEVSDQRDYLDQFFLIMNKIQWGAWAVAIIQAVGAAALIFNTIRMTAFARREQTSIMKLVGATNWYVRLPFLIEGMLAGIAGGLVASALLVVGYQLVVPDLRGEILFVPFIGLGHVVAVAPWLLVGGALIAAAASFLSLRRFLSV